MKMTFLRALLLTLVLAILLTGAIGCTDIYDAILGDSPVDTEDREVKTEIDQAMMEYMTIAEYQALLEYSSQFGIGISIGSGEGGTSLKTDKTMTPDQLRNTVYSVTTDESGKTVTKTWYDYFFSMAEATAVEVGAFCKEAEKHNVVLSDAEFFAVTKEYVIIEAKAKLCNMSMGRYVKTYYGSAVSPQMVFDALKMYALTAKWRSIKEQEFSDTITDDLIEAHYLQNREEYDVYCDYIGITFEVVLEDKTEDDIKAYRDAQERFSYYIEDLASATDREAFSEKLKGYLLAEEKLRMATEKGKDVTDLTAEEIAECDSQANEALRGSIRENVKEVGFVATQSGSVITIQNGYISKLQFSYYDAEVANWLFEHIDQGDGAGRVYLRKPNDVMKSVREIDADTAPAGNSSTYSIYFYIDGMHTNNTPVRDTDHIFFGNIVYDGLTSSENLDGKVKELADRLFERNKDNEGYELTAYAMACELLDMLFEEGKITEVAEGDKKYYKIDKDVFKEYSLFYTSGIKKSGENVFVYLEPYGFDEWLFDPDRVVGEISYPEPVFATSGYSIIYCAGEDTVAWKQEIKEKLLAELIQNYIKEITENN